MPENEMYFHTAISLRYDRRGKGWRKPETWRYVEPSLDHGNVPWSLTGRTEKRLERVDKLAKVK